MRRDPGTYITGIEWIFPLRHEALEIGELRLLLNIRGLFSLAIGGARFSSRLDRFRRHPLKTPQQSTPYTHKLSICCPL